MNSVAPTHNVLNDQIALIPYLDPSHTLWVFQKHSASSPAMFKLTESQIT